MDMESLVSAMTANVDKSFREPSKRPTPNAVSLLYETYEYYMRYTAAKEHALVLTSSQNRHITMQLASIKQYIKAKRSAGEEQVEVLSSAKPKWAGALLPVCFMSGDYGAVLQSLIIPNETVFAKIVDSPYEEFVGKAINSLVRRSPALTYTYGAKACQSMIPEKAGVASFPTADLDRSAKYTLLLEHVRNRVSMKSWLQHKRGEDEIRSVLLQIASSLLQAHREAGFIHGDLSCDNILISESGPSVRLYVGGDYICIPSRWEAKIVNFSKSYLRSEDSFYYNWEDARPVNIYSPWNDIIRLIMTLPESSNDELLDKVISTDLLATQEASMSVSNYRRLPPSQKWIPLSKFVFSEMPTLDAAVNRLMSGLVRTPCHAPASRIHELSALSRLAIFGISLSVSEKPLDPIIPLLQDRMNAASEIMGYYISGKCSEAPEIEVDHSALKSIFALCEFLYNSRSREISRRLLSEARSVRDNYETTIETWDKHC